MMRKYLLFFTIALVATSCAEVYFTTPQPQKGMTLKSFIDDVQGVYADSLLNVSVLKNQLIVGGETFKLVSELQNENEVVVKFYNNFYFASFKDSIYYSVFMANFYEDKLAVYMLEADPRSLDVIKKFVEVQTVSAEKKEYLIAADKKQFDELINNEQFKVVTVLKRE